MAREEEWLGASRRHAFSASAAEKWWLVHISVALSSTVSD